MNTTLSAEELEDLGPQVTSADPEERKLARSLRIQRRIEAIKKQHETMSDEEQEANKTALEIQILASAEQLEKLFIEGEELITNVNIGNEAREVSRREKEKIERAELMRKLEEEADEATKLYEEINQKWTSLMLYNDPLDIHDSINMQKNKCQELLKQKDEIIKMLREEIDKGEIEFVKDQSSQKEDIVMLANRIDKQVDLMRRAYKTELSMIEKAVENERIKMTEDNAHSWDALYKQRDALEEQNMINKNEQQEEFLGVIQINRVMNEELYRETKIALANENQVLQQELEHLKAFCLLNEEKLDYNYQILKRREDENLIIKSQQKKLINKLRDDINIIRSKIIKYRTDSEKHVAKLTEEIHKLRKGVFQVETKAKLLKEVNDMKYSQVWKLNEEIANEKIHQILSIDKIIYEQLLGVVWNYPKWLKIKQCDLPSYKSAVQVMNDEKQKFTQNESEFNDVFEMPHILKQTIIQTIGERSWFLMEENLCKIIKSLKEEHGNIIKIDTVFSCLGIQNSADYERLLEYFSPFLWCRICDNETEKLKRVFGSGINLRVVKDTKDTTVIPATVSESTSVESTIHQFADIILNLHQPMDATEELFDQPDRTSLASLMSTSNDSETVSESMLTSLTIPSKPLYEKGSVVKKFHEGHPIVVEIAYVHRVLRNFVASHNKNKVHQPTIQERLASKHVTISRSLSNEDLDLFWNQFTSVFTSEKRQLWDSLIYGLNRYYAILKDRHKIIEEVNQLRTQNAELKHLLKSCTPGNKKETVTCSFVSSPSTLSKRS